MTHKTHTVLFIRKLGVFCVVYAPFLSVMTSDRTLPRLTVSLRRATVNCFSFSQRGNSRERSKRHGHAQKRFVSTHLSQKSLSCYTEII